MKKLLVDAEDVGSLLSIIGPFPFKVSSLPGGCRVDFFFKPWHFLRARKAFESMETVLENSHEDLGCEVYINSKFMGFKI